MATNNRKDSPTTAARGSHQAMKPPSNKEPSTLANKVASAQRDTGASAIATP